MVRAKLIAVSLFSLATFSFCFSCKTTKTASASKADGGFPPEGPMVLPGGPETVLVYNPEGDWALVHIKEPLEKIVVPQIEVEGKFATLSGMVSSKGGKFYVASLGKLNIIDAKTGAIEQKLDAPGAKGVAVDSKDTGYLFSDQEVIEFNTLTGKIGRKLGVSGESWTLTDTQILLADRETLTVINRESFQTVGTVSLGDPNFYSPILNVSYRTKTGEVVITGSPQRPRNVGCYVTVNVRTMERSDCAMANTFGGSRYFLNKTDRLIVLQHTSTPVSSTHAMYYAFGANGEKEVIGDHGTMFDLFEEDNNMQFNADETIVNMSSECFTGFCKPGKGIILYDLKNDKRLPNITDDFLGFVPKAAYFAKP